RFCELDARPSRVFPGEGDRVLSGRKREPQQGGAIGRSQRLQRNDGTALAARGKRGRLRLPLELDEDGVRGKLRDKRRSAARLEQEREGLRRRPARGVSFSNPLSFSDGWRAPRAPF